MENNNKIKITFNRVVALSAVLLLMLTLAPISYAFFTVSVAGNNNASENIVQAGTMSLEFTDGNVIGTTSSWIPGSSITKSFTVENTGTLTATYSVVLEDVVNTFVDKSDLVYEITGTSSGNSSAFNTSSAIEAPDGDSSIINNQSINPGDIHSYTITLTFLSKNENQDDNQNKSFSAKIQVYDSHDVSINASNVTFTSSKTNKTNVSDALDELYELLN